MNQQENLLTGSPTALYAGAAERVANHQAQPRSARAVCCARQSRNEICNRVTYPTDGALPSRRWEWSASQATLGAGSDPNDPGRKLRLYLWPRSIPSLGGAPAAWAVFGSGCGWTLRVWPSHCWSSQRVGG